MPSSQETRLTFVLVARIPAEGIASFRAYEGAVLPLLSKFGGRLEHRPQNQDGTIETHIVSFPSEAEFQNYRNDTHAHIGEARVASKTTACFAMRSSFSRKSVKDLSRVFFGRRSPAVAAHRRRREPRVCHDFCHSRKTRARSG
jgi:hypothetical protein